MNFDRYIKLAISEAEKSTHRQRVGAIIFKGKRIISKGHNYPERMVRSVNKKFIRWPHSIHAEMAVILSSRCDLRGMSMLIVRINKKGELRYAEPCNFCKAYIEHVFLKKVFYSDSNKGIIELC